MYTNYHIKLRFKDRIVGGIPKSKEIITSWIKAQTGFDDEITQQQIAEATDEMKEQIVDEKVAKSWMGFKSDGNGLYIENRNIMGMLKESANILKGIKGGESLINQKALKARLVERVSVTERRIYLGVKEPTGYEEVPIHVMTRMGPRTSLKRFDYVEKPEIEFTLEVLDDGIITEERLRTILEHGERLGLGADRSQQEGKFEVIRFDVMKG